MGMGFAPTWLRQVSPLLHKTTLTTSAVGLDLNEKTVLYNRALLTDSTAEGFQHWAPLDDVVRNEDGRRHVPTFDLQTVVGAVKELLAVSGDDATTRKTRSTLGAQTSATATLIPRNSYTVTNLTD